MVTPFIAAFVAAIPLAIDQELPAPTVISPSLTNVLVPTCRPSSFSSLVPTLTLEAIIPLSFVQVFLGSMVKEPEAKVLLLPVPSAAVVKVLPSTSPSSSTLKPVLWNGIPVAPIIALPPKVKPPAALPEFCATETPSIAVTLSSLPLPLNLTAPISPLALTTPFASSMVVAFKPEPTLSLLVLMPVLSIVVLTPILTEASPVSAPPLKLAVPSVIVAAVTVPVAVKSLTPVISLALKLTPPITEPSAAFTMPPDCITLLILPTCASFSSLAPKSTVPLLPRSSLPFVMVVAPTLIEFVASISVALYFAAASVPVKVRFLALISLPAKVTPPILLVVVSLVVMPLAFTLPTVSTVNSLPVAPMPKVLPFNAPFAVISAPVILPVTLRSFLTSASPSTVRLPSAIISLPLILAVVVTLP